MISGKSLQHLITNLITEFICLIFIELCDFGIAESRCKKVGQSLAILVSLWQKQNHSPIE